MKEKIRALYFGDSDKAHRFRLGLLVFDLITIAFFIFSSMLESGPLVRVADVVIALVLLLEFQARLLITKSRLRFIFKFDTLADLVVIFSLLAPIFLDNLGFLRVVRMLRLLRSYHMLNALRREFSWFKANEQIIQSSVNLVIFIFVVTAIVYVLESGRNDDIGNYLDALYFTVATLTTTGFGDITMDDTLGRMVAVVIMVFGVALFLRLVQTIFRPTKVQHECDSCGLSRHDPDAVHCKHCGVVLNIPTEGDWT
ncbi:potassium channel family protein [Kordiimonas aestuarii]|uniref:potassium channel family protein n=1 Tax=Kordiimonas aestuarii TaxID=1005925 RepID=UPI0021D203BA|nr:potassium channel family protein [Kordiimonas aestuarii]